MGECEIKEKAGGLENAVLQMLKDKAKGSSVHPHAPAYGVTVPLHDFYYAYIQIDVVC